MAMGMRCKGYCTKDCHPGPCRQKIKCRNACLRSKAGIVDPEPKRVVTPVVIVEVPNPNSGGEAGSVMSERWKRAWNPAGRYALHLLT